MQRIKPTYSINITDDDIKGSVQRLGDALAKGLQGLPSISILNGTQLDGIQLSTSPLRVSHKLGRQPLGYIVVKRNANATVYDADDSQPTLFLNLTASASVTVSLWVY